MMKVLRPVSFFKQRHVNSSLSHCNFETRRRVLSVGTGSGRGETRMAVIRGKNYEKNWMTKQYLDRRGMK
jgi:hypothetical protein